MTEARETCASLRTLWHDSTKAPLGLGCANCPEFGLCGGLRTERDFFDCNDFCCAQPSKCDSVCRHRPSDFVRSLREIDSFDLDRIPRAPRLELLNMPEIVPFVGSRYGRAYELAEPAVAVSLYDLVRLGRGSVQAASRVEMARRFNIRSDAAIIASGVEQDRRVEGWWALARRGKIIEGLREAGVSLVTTPNFSLFTNVPRYDNLHAMKRIALVWAEFCRYGLPAALHTNARTDRDYERWGEFIRERDEVVAIAFEFGTGGGVPLRIEWHTDRLTQLAAYVGRPLTLILRGGTRQLARLRKSFSRVVLIETDAFIRSIKRRRAHILPTGRLKWTSSPTAPGDTIDELFNDNIRTVRAALLAGARSAA